MSDLPIAVLATSCRFAPDVRTPNAFWEMILEGRDGVGTIPDSRWAYAGSGPQARAVLSRTTRAGAFLDDVAGFDASFFGISPREAAALDPQQRMLLELAWEALELAGIPPERLRGTDTGVYMAATAHDYADRMIADLPTLDAWAMNGAFAYSLANRISYQLDLHGPSMAIDAACAGSLAAVQLACHHLWREEGGVALVGGVNVMAAPGPTVALDAAGATSSDGRSKAFDADADGYGRGEGGGVVVLKLLRDAVRDGDPVLAVLRGIGVSHDGTGEGIMAPNEAAQVRMMRHVYDRAGLAASSVDYVDAHGTGTPTGDPIELRALSAVMGADRQPDDPCLIGSAKPNVGHLEAGAGIASMIKTVQALARGVIPPSVHRRPTEAIDWERSGLRIVDHPTPWPERAGPRRAGVSSFGVGGTIAHMVLEEAPPKDDRSASGRSASGRLADGNSAELASPRVFPVSAASPKGLRAQASALSTWMHDEPDVDLRSIGHTLALRRPHLAERTAIVASDRAALAASLTALADGSEATPTGHVPRSASTPGVVFVFSGHGAQWAGMGQQLLDQDRAFTEVIDRLDLLFEDEVGVGARKAILAGDWSSTALTQAMTFAMHVGLAAAWRARGVEPAAIVGHSLGEVAASVVSGSVDLESAARFACRRGRILERAAGGGAMAMVSMSFEEAESRVSELPGVSAAIASGPSWTVVSGDADAVGAASARWEAEGLVVRRVDTEVPFHSPLMDGLLDDIRMAGQSLSPRETSVPSYSSVCEDPRSDRRRDGDYQTDAVRWPVRFRQAVEAAIEDGHRVFLEVSSHPIVTHPLSEMLETLGEGVVAHSLHRTLGELEALAGNVASLHCHGVSVDWTALHGGGTLADLPTTQWQHQPFWLPTPAVEASVGGHDPQSHTLIGTPVSVSGLPELHVWLSTVDLDSRPYPGIHRLRETEVMPVAVFVQTILEAAERSRLGSVEIIDLDARSPLVVDRPREVQVVVDGHQVRLASRSPQAAARNDADSWVCHATARLEPSSATDGDRTAEERTAEERTAEERTAEERTAEERTAEERTDLAGVRTRCPERLDWPDVERSLRDQGLEGYAFDWTVEDLSRGPGEFLGVVSATGDGPTEQWADLLDGAFTLLQVLSPEDGPRLLTAVGRARFLGAAADRVWVHGWVGPDETATLRLLSETGELLVELAGITTARVIGSAVHRAAPTELVYDLRWSPATQIPGSPPAEVVLVGHHPTLSPALLSSFEGDGVRCSEAATPQEAAAAGADVVLVLASPPAAGVDVPAAAAADAWLLISTLQALAGPAGPGSADVQDARTTVWCVTTGVRDGSGLSQAPSWGVARVAAGEHAALWGGLLDLDPDLPDPASAIRQVLEAPCEGEDVIGVTAEGCLVPRLDGLDAATSGPAASFHPDATYLITGGLGALGLATARHLADRGARHLVLLGRTGLGRTGLATDDAGDQSASAPAAAVSALRRAGVEVRVVAADIADLAATRTALAGGLADGMPAVRGVVHAAGTAESAPLLATDRESVERAMRAKVAGTLVLDTLFPPGTLDFLVLFSSCGQLARTSGQTAYAAANAFLDGFAVSRARSGHADTMSLAWSSWRGEGMSAGTDVGLIEANGRGLDAISVDEAFDSWLYATRFDRRYLAVVRMLPVAAHLRPRICDELPATDDAESATPSEASEGVWRQQGDDPEAELLLDVREQVSVETQVPLEDVQPGGRLSDLGLDSVMSVRLRARLVRRYGVDLPPTLLWDYPTPTTIAAYLLSALA